MSFQVNMLMLPSQLNQLEDYFSKDDSAIGLASTSIQAKETLQAEG